MGHVSVGGKKFVFLQERDLRLFRWVAEQKLASKDQLWRLFFPNRGVDVRRPDRVCRRRLGELCRFGFLEPRHVVTDGIQLYQVGRPGLAELARREGGEVLPYLPGIDLKSYEHDLRVSDARIDLEWLGATAWQSERRLHQGGARGHVPDAVFSLGENRCALEIELSLKRLDRYSIIFRHYADTRTDIDVVFYLCGSVAIRETLVRLASDCRRFYFGLWTEFEAAPTTAKFSNQHDEVALEELT